MSIKDVLSLPAVYNAFSGFVNVGKAYDVLVKQYIAPKEGDKVLDLGCGTGSILDHLKGVLYTGVDMSERYINMARDRYNGRGRFICEKIDMDLCGKVFGFDIVIAVGVLHHLDEREAGWLFEIAKNVLKPGGRLVTYDGCFVRGQSAMAKIMLMNDRGKFVRPVQGYLDLAAKRFENVDHDVRHDLLSVPYTHIIMCCVK